MKLNHPKTSLINLLPHKSLILSWGGGVLHLNHLFFLAIAFKQDSRVHSNHRKTRLTGLILEGVYFTGYIYYVIQEPYMDKRTIFGHEKEQISTDFKLVRSIDELMMWVTITMQSILHWNMNEIKIMWLIKQVSPNNYYIFSCLRNNSIVHVKKRRLILANVTIWVLLFITLLLNKSLEIVSHFCPTGCIIQMC